MLVLTGVLSSVFFSVLAPLSVYLHMLGQPTADLPITRYSPCHCFVAGASQKHTRAGLSLALPRPEHLLGE